MVGMSFDQRMELWTAYVGHGLETSTPLLHVRLSSLLDQFLFTIYEYLAEKVS